MTGNTPVIKMLFLVSLFVVLFLFVILLNMNDEPNLPIILSYRHGHHRVLLSLHDTTNDELSSSSISYIKQIDATREAHECCICFTEAPLRTINETEFQRIFHFYCCHASSDICYSCWMDLFNRTRTKLHHRRCPLCRASNGTAPCLIVNGNQDRVTNYPFGDDLNLENRLISVKLLLYFFVILFVLGVSLILLDIYGKLSS